MAAAPQVGRGLRIPLFFLLCSSLHAGTFYVTVAGLGGEPDYEQRFAMLADDIDKIVKSGGPSETLKGPAATKANVRSALEKVARESKTQDALVLMLIGHGTFDGVDYKMNLPGPDLSATELAAMLNRIPAGRQLVVNMTSASGASINALKKDNRVVVTATKTGTEKNATVFARFWVEALRDPAADTDKNEVISALEAFRYAEQKTAQHLNFPDLHPTGKEHGPTIDGEARRNRQVNGQSSGQSAGQGGGTSSGDTDGDGRPDPDARQATPIARKASAAKATRARTANSTHGREANAQTRDLILA